MINGCLLEYTYTEKHKELWSVSLSSLLDWLTHQKESRNRSNTSSFPPSLLSTSSQAQRGYGHCYRFTDKTLTQVSSTVNKGDCRNILNQYEKGLDSCCLLWSKNGWPWARGCWGLSWRLKGARNYILHLSSQRKPTLLTSTLLWWSASGEFHWDFRLTEM